MDITHPLPLLGGLSPRQFMSRHWQKKPLLVRGAMPGFAPLLPRAELFALAARDDVESRLVARSGKDWLFRRGPFRPQGPAAAVAAGLDPAGAGRRPAPCRRPTRCWRSSASCRRRGWTT